MKTKLIAITAAAMLAGMSQFAVAAPAASPVAGIPVLGGLLGSLTAGLPSGGGTSARSSLPGLSALGSLPLPALPLGAVAAPFAGLPVVGPMAVQGASAATQSVPSLVNLLLNVVVNLPGLGSSLAGLGAGGLPGLSPATLTGLPGKLGPAATNLLQALNSATAVYGLPVLPTTLPGL
ncbi:MAG: hypothetical protein ACRETM_11290 [Stenotrophobium sp.]